jgi:predicted nucleic acid-binding Zn ribbon protein
MSLPKDRCIVCNRAIKLDESCRHPKCGEVKKKKKKTDSNEEWAKRLNDGMRGKNG